MMSFLVSETPLAVTSFVLPPASVLIIILACSPIHFPHAACIFCSSGCRIVGSVFAQSAITEAGMRYRTRNFCLVASVMVFPSLGDRIEVGRIGRQIKQLCAGGFDRFAYP